MDEAKVNEVARKFGTILMDGGIRMVQSAYRDFKPQLVPFSTIRQYCLDAGISVPLIQLDSDHNITDWANWEVIKDTTLIDKLIYYIDAFDCDNFAFLFSSLSALLFKLNSAGTTYGKLYDNNTNTLINYHYFNVIPTIGGKVYCYEPMSDNFCLIEKGKPIVMSNGWRYEILNITFF